MTATTTNKRNAKAEADKPLEGQTAVEGIEPKATTSAQVILYAKGDVADKIGMTTQALANRAGRDPEFPQPTYSNQSGSVQLYTKEDVEKIIDFLEKPERERIAKLAAARKSL